MTTPEKRIYDANRAKEVLDNEVFQAVFKDMEADFINAWQNAPARDTEGREKIWVALNQLKQLHQRLQTTLETGRLAGLEQEHLQKQEQQQAWNSLSLQERGFGKISRNEF